LYFAKDFSSLSYRTISTFMKILVAEDEPLMLMAIEAKLKNEGFEVIGVQDGREALKILETVIPDLIITDILMPYTSGLELISIVKSEQNKKVPIIVLSGLGQEDTVMEAFQLGADDFITKPFNPTELSVRVKRLLKISTGSIKRK
jgi:DNA-binding response OmpR family regulator